MSVQPIREEQIYKDNIVQFKKNDDIMGSDRKLNLRVRFYEKHFRI